MNIKHVLPLHIPVYYTYKCIHIYFIYMYEGIITANKHILFSLEQIFFQKIIQGITYFNGGGLICLNLCWCARLGCCVSSYIGHMQLIHHSVDSARNVLLKTLHFFCTVNWRKAIFCFHYRLWSVLMWHYTGQNQCAAASKSIEIIYEIICFFSVLWQFIIGVAAMTIKKQ